MRWLFLFLLISCNEMRVTPNIVGSADTNAPKLIISYVPGVTTVSGPITVTITATKPVTGLDSSDLTLSNCTSSSFTNVNSLPGGYNLFTVLITPSSVGSFSVSIASGKCVDSRGTSNTASNTLSLTYDTGSFSPLSADFWYDATQVISSGVSYDNDNLFRPTVTTKDSNAFTGTSLNSATYTHPAYNGEGVYMNGKVGWSFGTTSDWKDYHNGNAWTAYVTFKHLSNPTSATPIAFLRTSTTSLTTNSQTGLLISYYHPSGSVNSFKISICNNAGGTAPFEIIGSANDLVVDNYYTLKIVFTGSSLTAWLKQAGGSYTQIGQDNSGSGLSSSNSNSSLNFGGSTSWRGYLKHIIFYKRELQSSETTALESFLDDEMADVVTPTDVNVYLWWGQSNCGSASNDGIAAELNGKVGAHTFFLPSSASDMNKVGHWCEMELGVNQNSGNSLTLHGFQMRFGYEMNQSAPTYLLGRWVGATRLIPPGDCSAGSWSALSPCSDTDYYPYWMDGGTAGNAAVVMDGLEEIVHVKRKNPVIRGLIKSQGETDQLNSSTTQAAYFNESDAFITTTLSKLSAAGYGISKIRVAIIRTQPRNSPYGDYVRDADVDVVTHLGTNHPEYFADNTFGTYIDTDGLAASGGHFTADSQSTIGLALKAYFLPYINE